jgi:hypothetical protein
MKDVNEILDYFVDGTELSSDEFQILVDEGLVKCEELAFFKSYTLTDAGIERVKNK